MEQRRVVVVTGLVILLILGVVIGLIYFLTVNIRNRISSNTRTTSSPTPSITIRTDSPPPVTGGGMISNTKIYAGSGFSLSYPNFWGVLKCANSENFEFDPENNSDQLGVVCDRALKPITVIVGAASCQGESMISGAVRVFKSKTNTPTGVNYRWCTQTTPSLDITHRVSSAGDRATSKTDYSAQVEQLISTFNVGVGGS